MKFSTISLLALTAVKVSADIELQWTIQPYDNERAEVDDTITFTFEDGHNVYINPSGSCDPTDAILVGETSPVTYTFARKDLGQDLFFSCNVDGHCDAGQHITVSVVEDVDVTNAPTPPGPGTTADTEAPTPVPPGGPGEGESEAPTPVPPGGEESEAPTPVPPGEPGEDESEAPTPVPPGGPGEEESEAPTPVPPGGPGGEDTPAPTSLSIATETAAPTPAGDDTPAPSAFFGNETEFFGNETDTETPAPSGATDSEGTPAPSSASGTEGTPAPSTAAGPGSNEDVFATPAPESGSTERRLSMGASFVVAVCSLVWAF